MPPQCPGHGLLRWAVGVLVQLEEMGWGEGGWLSACP